VSHLNRECLNSWRTLKDRDFDVVSWTDQSVKDFLAKCPIVKAKTLCERARNYGEASDILRMAITYTYGGLYVDWDVLLVDPDGFLAVMGDFKTNSCVLIRDRHTKAPDFSCVYDNSLFYMRKGHPLALDFLGEMERNYSKHPVPDTPYLTGPLALTSFLDSHPHYKNDCRMVDMLDMYAFDYEEVVVQTKDQTMREVLKNNWKPGGAPAIHFWTHTWFPKRKWAKRVLDKVWRTFRMATGAR
jgi:Glycosyltransferase sugar-binding region containing DXD motif